METNKKFTDSYAYELAEDYEKNNGNPYSMGIDQAFYSGYMKSIEETEPDKLLKSLIYAKSIIDKLEELHPEIAHKLMGVNEMIEMESIIEKQKKQ